MWEATALLVFQKTCRGKDVGILLSLPKVEATLWWFVGSNTPLFCQAWNLGQVPETLSAEFWRRPEVMHLKLLKVKDTFIYLFFHYEENKRYPMCEGHMKLGFIIGFLKKKKSITNHRFLWSNLLKDCLNSRFWQRYGIHYTGSSGSVLHNCIKRKSIQCFLSPPPLLSVTRLCLMVTIDTNVLQTFDIRLWSMALLSVHLLR